MTKDDIGYAIFALGRFIDYRLDDGMAEEQLHAFMQAYLNLSYHQEGLLAPDSHELQSRKVDALHSHEQEMATMTPSWLPHYEKLRLCHLLPDNDPYT